MFKIDILRKRLIGLKTRIVFGPEEIDLAKDEVIVLCLVKNGATYIDEFIKHYFLLGVKHIVFLDNNSTDQTIEKIKKYNNVTVLWTDSPFGHDNDMRMREYLIERFALGKWSLSVDIDEFFDYPYSDKIKLKSLIKYLESNSFTAVVSHMLDMFPGAIYRNENNFLIKKHKYYTLSSLSKTEYYFENGKKPETKIRLMTGGIRKKIFNLNSYLIKHALIFSDDNTKRGRSGHTLACGKIADLSSVLYHYKFVGQFFDYAEDAAKREFQSNQSSDYKFYNKVFLNKDFLLLKDADSIWIDNVNELVDKDFLVVSDNFKNFANV